MGGTRPARPVIGVSCYVEDVDRRPWVAQRSAVLPHRYVEQLERAGAVVVVLPPRSDADEAMALEVLERLDAVVIAGGADVAADRYGADPHPTSQSPRPDRDAWELALCRASATLELPALGICRGMQVMAVAAGARLEQHVPDRVGHDSHCPRPGEYASHHATPVEGSRLADLLGTDPLQVPTYHHQAVVPETLDGSGWVPSAWHEDGTLEAMEDPSPGFRVAVQWHPEAGDDPRLFEALVEAARRRRADARSTS
ncbi:gamma-glutamyl-gamma-aminobutyrate hydrolase family protein [Oryzobacter sp. R7]|uniref:gamma-glutamyl-gamma-aminobutyrate hydrolase family protein n=1 Tax=Oryzobacter faecalis TaxID=3388656 RepID=UPI00398CAA31